MRNQTLMKEARKAIIKQIEELGEITIEEAIKLVEPHFIFDSDQAKRSAIRRTATSIIARVKDDKGIRKNFIIKDKNDNSKAIDIEKARNVKELKIIRETLKRSRDTIDKSIKKINQRENVLAGQLSINDIKVR